jgi:hypothetical protein
MGSRHLGIIGLNGCFEFRNQAFELFQIVCFICFAENLSVNFIVYAPLAILIQKLTGRHSQLIDVNIFKVHISVRHDGTGE